MHPRTSTSASVLPDHGATDLRETVQHNLAVARDVEDRHADSTHRGEPRLDAERRDVPLHAAGPALLEGRA